MKKIIKSVILSLASIFIMFGCSNSASGVTTATGFTTVSDSTTDSDSTTTSDSTDSSSSTSTDNSSSTTIENLDPSTLSENGQYFTVEGTTDGIKITLKDDLKIKKDSGSNIQVYDMSKNKLPLMIAASVGSDIESNKKVYTYKFVENNTDYIVKLDALKTDEKWVEDWAKCTAKGGYNLSDYIKVDALKSIKMNLGWNGFQFYAGINSDKVSTKEDLIIDESIFDSSKDESNYKFMFQFFLILGEPEWKNSEWWTWGDDIKIDNFRTEFEIATDKVAGKMNDLKEKWENKYCGYMVPKLKLADSQEYEFEQIWSEQKVFDSSKVIAGTYKGNVLGGIDSLEIYQNKTFLWSKTDGSQVDSQYKGTVNYDGSSTVVFNMTHQKDKDSDLWTDNSKSYTGTYSNNKITINVTIEEEENSFVFTKE